MIDMTRRELVVSAGAVSAVLGLGGPLTLFPSGVAQAATEKGFHAFKVGDVEIVTVLDGVWQRPLDEGFVRNAKIEQVWAALEAGGYAPDTIPVSFTVTFARTGGKTVMFDAGTGGQLAPTAGKLAANMAAAGIDPAKIDVVAMTHFHPDHVFGLMAAGSNAQVYPNAEIIVPAAEYEWWTDAGVFARLPADRHGLAKRLQDTLPSWKNVRRVASDTEILPGIRSVAAYGHTAGHTVFQIASGKEQLFVTADAAHFPALFLKNPGWHVMFDSDPEAAMTTRKALFDRVVAERALVTGYHFGMPGAGRIEADGSGYTFVPLA
ncbi:MAG: MBL fold metallo-hydrolase [Hyphomicrobiaceae bacterium]|nr:MBL fold metallo-hydrolase [Hyphomicrobiaceae bacterium]